MIKATSSVGSLILTASSGGLSGALTGWFYIEGGDGLTTLGMALVTAVSCAFGILSSATRRKEGMRSILMNAGAIWITSFYVAKSFGTSLESAAIAGLGVGLCGVSILNLLEKTTMYLAKLALISSKLHNANLSPEETEKLMGERRQNAQTVLSAMRLARKEEVAVEERAEAARRSQWVDNSDDQE